MKFYPIRSKKVVQKDLFLKFTQRRRAVRSTYLISLHKRFMKVSSPSHKGIEPVRDEKTEKEEKTVRQFRIFQGKPEHCPSIFPFEEGTRDAWIRKNPGQLDTGRVFEVKRRESFQSEKRARFIAKEKIRKTDLFIP